MRIHRITSPEITPDFDAALKRAAAIADEQPGDNMLLTWYDRERDIESPAHVSECHGVCAIKGFWEYVLNRGGKLAVDFDEGRFVFCFMPLGDLAPPQ
jgi:hypothetical protein